MKSKIKYTYSYSTSTVNMLDVKVTLNSDGTISTELYYKPTAAHQYLHNSSYHQPHLIKSIPKSQFIRVRRICSSVDLYWKHAKDMINFFHTRGYKLSALQNTASEIANINRDTYLQYKPPKYK